LLDEPFNAIDRATVMIILDYIWEKVKGKSSSAMLVTHDLEEIVLLCDRVVFMPHGTQIQFDPDFAALAPSARLQSDKFRAPLLRILEASKGAA